MSVAETGVIGKRGNVVLPPRLRQQLGIREGSLVLLEEPDAALHAGAIPALRDLLRALSQRTTVIATSHRIDLVRELDASEEVRVLDRRDGRPHVSSLADAKAERRWLRAFDPDEALARFGRERTP